MTQMSEKTTTAMLKALKDATEDAALDLDSVPWVSRGGFEVAKREAKDALPRLRSEYSDRIFSNAIFFYPVGNEEKCQQFAAVASQVGGTFTVDAQAVYQILAQKVEPTLGQRREFAVQQFTVMNDGIDDIMRAAPGQVDVTVPTSALKNLDAVPTFEALVAFIRNMVESERGKALVKLDVVRSVTDQAVSARFDAKTLAVVVLNTDEETRSALASGNRAAVVDVDSTEEITKAFAIKVFKEASSKGRKPN